MRLKKLLLFIILMFIPYSCVTLKLNSESYPVNSRWIYNDGENIDTVYIAYHGMFGKIYVKDSLNNKDVTAIGWVKEEFLFPIKENIQVEHDQ